MLNIIKNNWARLMEEKGYLIVSILLTACSMAAAVALTNKAEVKGHIAFVSEDASAEDNNILSANPYFTVTVLAEEPMESELLFHRYDAVVTGSDGNYKIETVKGEDFKALLQQALQNPGAFVPDTSKERRVGTNIIGYMMMFVLMQGVLYARFFSDDKEKHHIERVAMSPIAFPKYLLGHTVFILLLIFTPSFLTLAVMKAFGISIGFSLLQYAGLIGILAALSTTFALFLNSFFCATDTSNMLGSSLIVLTSILAGSFYSFAKSSDWFHRFLCILPQKDFINFADALEKGSLTLNTELQIIYVAALSLGFFLFACIKTQRDYVYHK